MKQHEKSTTNKRSQASRSNVLKLKLTATQNVIRNKCKTACANRIQREYEVQRAMKPLTASFSSSSISAKQVKQQQQSLAKNVSKRMIKCKFAKSNDPNDLCNRLRILLVSTNASDAIRSAEKNVIIRKLRDLKILV